MQLTSIPKDEQEDALSSFWTMLQECEAKADDKNDPVLKRWVEQWYEQWNRITQDNKAPRWKVKAKP
jgi:hypothetical protein